MQFASDAYPIEKRRVFVYSLLAKSMCLGLFLLPAQLFAEGKAGGMVIVADSRHLTGITAWWVNIYNESHFYFALLTVVSIPLGGAILGSLADLLISRLGIDLKSRTLREN